ncbi:hypothetical protein B0T22DRAFT_490742 [Podospora appendiculata]|uniref:Rhodopsin domain-containing protein n=1 Tax=Podospora appendiculata TaxID=314037 RepID=A0AAE0XBH2_9PEZI|nr:hypothetical protein B0T22DRAFT_490742 [Podospora appendiculata]
MAFNVFHDYYMGVNFVLIIVAIPICVASVLLRFMSTMMRTGQRYWLENVFAFLALLCFLVYVSCDMWILLTLNGRSLFEMATLPMDTIVKSFKVGYVMNIQTPMNQTFAKLSLLVLYHRLFYISSWFVRSIYVIGLVQICWCIAMVCVRLFQCHPIDAFWNPFLQGQCLDGQVILAVGEPINSLVDFIMVGMAIWMVHKLKVTRADKVRVMFLFALGGFAGIIGIVNVTDSYGSVGNSSRNSTWYIAQQGASVVCCCAPLWKSVVKEFTIFHKIGSSLFGRFSGKSSKGSKESSRQSTPSSKKPNPDSPIRPAGRGRDQWQLPYDGSTAGRSEIDRAERNAGLNDIRG